MQHRPSRRSTPVLPALAGKDGLPLTKLEAFAALLAEGASAAQLALLELSYADINASTDVDALFTAFKKAHDALRAGRAFVEAVASAI